MDFIHKLSVSQKECNETRYWPQLLYESEEIDERMYQSLCSDCAELLRLLTHVIVKSKEKEDTRKQEKPAKK